ncbi:MAG: Rho termination factor N-terminal domain-containing protein [Thermodesulfobacteriota bacterium]
MKMPEIRSKAQQLGIRPGKMSKTELIRAIQQQEGNTPCFATAMSRCEQTACCWRDDCLKMAMAA